ncbi:Alpha/beta hydrolase fold-3 [Stereum hirsutum FP-91666 SS1]|uniref:Alpha/beta hydrolase fold-3 n=1 Tax=Stereum hirsutum (strain FP-91666) TaxID=721885 RepID=UPI00044497CA|nr:Alpha/beta hydrolase fold-3 [Stereum hirsutum FP-91666 SS1]EIM80570.1 Alpha/beta hydrolase fold-3 [Stereum hirsutum FP-91666 SS1]
MSEETFPLLVWYHGGGWAAGHMDQDDYDLRMLCVKVGISIVNVNYRKAPECPFPTFMEDSYAALKWALTNAAELHASPAKGFIISGQSAGGEIAAVLSHWARDDPFFQGEGRCLTGQLLQCPLVLHPLASENTHYKDELRSMEQFNDPKSPMANADDIRWYSGLTGAGARDPNFSPILFTSHSNLPPMVIMICGLDALRDEEFLYERVLREAGVKTKTYMYPGLPHCFYMFMRHISMSQQFMNEYVEGVKWLLEQT